MLTMKAIFEDGVVHFLAEVPVEGARQVLVTFLDDDLGDLVIPKQHLNRTLNVLRESKLLPSKRLIEILDLTRQGFTNEEIGEKLGLHAGSVRNHLTKGYKVLKVKNRAQAIAKAIEYGFI